MYPMENMNSYTLSIEYPKDYTLSQKSCAVLLQEQDNKNRILNTTVECTFVNRLSADTTINKTVDMKELKRNDNISQFNTINEYISSNIEHIGKKYPKFFRLINTIQNNWLLISFLTLSTIGYIALCIVSSMSKDFKQDTTILSADTSETTEGSVLSTTSDAKPTRTRARRRV